MASSMGLHEAAELLRPETIDRHRAWTSLQEELEAADWYDQRVDAATDGELGGILAHNRDEEKEHASMLLEWLRRRDPKLDQHLRTYLFTDAPILELEADDTGSGDSTADNTQANSAPASNGSLGIGSLKGK
jgi:ferritin-like protein